jgi:hypothetical protein
MKNISMMVCILLVPYACKEDEMGQYPIDGTAPAKVASARVEENLPGGAIIVYDIPQEEDALYVKASYALDDGTPMDLKSSVYTKSITIVGIGRSRELPVVLTVVDRSQNESEPVTVIAYPLDSPIYAIANSMNIREDFGGIRLTWDNPEQLPIVIDVFKPDEDERMLQIDRFYSGSQEGKVNVRGQEPIETTYSVTLHDRWGNTTDPMSGRYTPLYEKEIDKSKFRRWNPPGLPYTAQAAGPIENMWDNSLSVTGGTLSVFAGTVPYFTFDMGQVAKISRFKINNRPETNLCYNHAMLRLFEIWGSPTPDVTDSFDGWQWVGYFEITKPSGLPLGQLTSEDIQYAAIDGVDFDVEDCPYVRYLRCRAIETWGFNAGIQLTELSLWGSEQEE